MTNTNKIIQVKKITRKKLQSSKLVLDFSGKDINEAVTNTLIRVAIDHIPTYAFNKDAITIEKNTSIYMNNHVVGIIENITIPDIDCSIVMLPSIYWKDIKYTYDVGDRLRHKEDTHNIEMSINVTNETNNNLLITTNDMKMYDNGKEIKNGYDRSYPHEILKLRPQEKFICKASAVLGIGKRNNKWTSTANSYHNVYENKTGDKINKIRLFISSIGQNDEYTILIKACRFIKIKLKEIKQLVGEIFHSLGPKGPKKKYNELILNDEDHTIGNILNNKLQDHKDITYSGLNKHDRLVNKIVIKFISTNNNPIKPLYETIDNIIKLYTSIEHKLIKLGSSK